MWFSIKVLNKNIKTKTKQKNTHKQIKKNKKKNVKNKTKIIIHTVTFRGIVNVEKIYCDFCFSGFFFYRRNTYLRYYIEHRHYININSIVNDKQKVVNVKFSKKKGKQFGLLLSLSVHDSAVRTNYLYLKFI